jgi:hypothetical protein
MLSRRYVVKATEDAEDDTANGEAPEKDTPTEAPSPEDAPVIEATPEAPAPAPAQSSEEEPVDATPVDPTEEDVFDDPAGEELTPAPVAEEGPSEPVFVEETPEDPAPAPETVSTEETDEAPAPIPASVPEDGGTASGPVSAPTFTTSAHLVRTRPYFTNRSFHTTISNNCFRVHIFLRAFASPCMFGCVVVRLPSSREAGTNTHSSTAPHARTNWCQRTCLRLKNERDRCRWRRGIMWKHKQTKYHGLEHSRTHRQELLVLRGTGEWSAEGWSPRVLARRFISE